MKQPRTAENLWEIQRLVREAIASDLWHHKYTQLALEEATGLSQPHISNILSGRRRANFRNLGDLAEAAGIQIEATITRGQPKARPKPEERHQRFEELGEQIEAEERKASAQDTRRSREPESRHSRIELPRDK
jgi:transcriptional regulator with XRE-family HTH domain